MHLVRYAEHVAVLYLNRWWPWGCDRRSSVAYGWSV